jgi:putative transposase
MIEPDYQEIPVSRQCKLISLSRALYYYKPCPDAEEEYNRLLMRLIDEQYTKTPFYGSRNMTTCLKRQGYKVNRKRIRRLMEQMGLEAVYPKPNLSKGIKEHKKYPYLLRDVEITRRDQVWSTDITYIRLKQGFIYLVAVIDWYSRYVLSWEISTTLDKEFCIKALNRALESGKPEIFNTDQGVQFTSLEFTGKLEDAGIKISMDGRGRALDNVFVERLWRSVKYEEVYLKDYQDVRVAKDGLLNYFQFYNAERPHQSLGNETPSEVYYKEFSNTKTKAGYTAH